MFWRAPWLRHRLALLTFAGWDAASVYLSYNLTYQIRIGKWEGVSLGLVVIAATWLMTSYLIGRYSPSAGEKNALSKQAGKTLLAGIAVIALFITHSWIYQVVDAQTRFRGFLIPLVVGLCLLSTVGQMLRTGMAERRRRRRRWYLVGSRSEAHTLREELRKEDFELQEGTVVASTDEWPALFKDKHRAFTGIAVGSLDENTEKDNGMLLRLREKGERVVPLMNWCEQELQRIPPELIHSEWLVQAEGFGLRPGSISWRIKRISDVAGALTLIAVTAPLLILGGVCIWLEDRGPIFYQQIRSGLHGKPIRIWKLRSMKINAEEAGAQWASKADPRITSVGRVIRATRVDELPQLFSVLSGDLSLIGPRPERPQIEERLEVDIPNYRIRHWVRPGLSGWAQVCYPYGASIEDSRMKLSYDLYYLRNSNFLLDLLITLKTMRLVLRAEGASPKTRKA